MEQKAASADALDLVLTETTALQNLIFIPQGSNFTERIGNEITITTIQINFDIKSQSPSNGGTLTDVARVLLIYDRQPNGATALIADVNEQINDPKSYRQLNNRLRFKTLWDSKLIPITNNSNNPNEHHVFTVYMKCALATTFSSSLAGVANITTGNLLLFFQADTTNGAEFECSYRTRIRFIDGRKPEAKLEKTWAMNVNKY